MNCQETYTSGFVFVYMALAILSLVFVVALIYKRGGTHVIEWDPLQIVFIVLIAYCVVGARKLRSKLAVVNTTVQLRFAIIALQS